MLPWTPGTVKLGRRPAGHAGRRLPVRLFVLAHSAVLASYRRRWEVLAQRGHAVTLVAPRRWTETNRWVELEEGGAGPLHLVRHQPLGDFWPSPRLRNVAHVHLGLARLMARTAPEVVEIMEEPYSLAAWHAMRVAARVAPAALRLVFSAQNLAKAYPWPFSRFEAEVLAAAHGAMPVDPLVTPVLRSKGLRAPATVIPLGVDTGHFRPLAPDPRRLPEAARGAPVVGYLGKLQREKGVMDLVEAVRRMSAPAHLVVVGAGPLEPRLRAAAAGGVRLHLLGPMPQAALPAMLATMDVVCVPSRTTATWMEQFGRAALEAMACGRPTLVSDSGSLPHVVGSGARVLPEADPRAWARALDELCTDPSARQDLGRRGRARVRDHYTWEAVARQHEAAWRAAREFRGD